MPSDTLKKLAVVLTSDTSGLKKGFKEAGKAGTDLEKQFAKLGGVLKGIGAVGAVGLAAASTAAVAAGVALTKAAKATIDFSSEVGTLSERTGLSVENLEAMKFAAEQTGTSLEKLTKGAAILQKNLGTGTRETVEAVQALGLSYEDLKQKAPDQQLNDVLTAISQIENPTQRSAVAMTLLGKSGLELVPVSGQLAALSDRAEELGLVLAEKDVWAAKALGEAFDAMDSTLDGLVRQIGAAITSNESLHVLVAGLTDVFAALSGQVAGSRDVLSSLVSQGVILVTKGLVLMVDAMQGVMDWTDTVRIGWKALYATGLDLALGLEQLNLRYLKLVGTKEDVAASEAAIKLIDAERIANANAADDIVASNSRRTDAIQAVRVELQQLVKDVTDAAGKEHEAAAATRDLTRDTNLLSDADRKAAAEAAKLAGAIEKQRQKMTGQFDPSEVAAFKGALEGLGSASDVALEELEATAMMVLKLQQQGEELPPVADDIVDAWAQFAIAAEQTRLANEELEKQKAAWESLGPTVAEVSTQFDRLQAVVAKKGGITNLSDAQLKNFIGEMEGLADVGELTTAQWEALGAAYEEAMKRGVLETEGAKDSTIEWGDALQGIALVVGTFNEDLASTVLIVGNIADAFRDAKTPAEKLAAVLSGISQIGGQIGGKAGGVIQGAAGGALTGLSIAGPWGALAGGVIGGITSLFGQSEKEKLNDVRDAWLEEQGGWLDLQKRLHEITDEDIVKKIFDAQTVEQFQEAAQLALDTLDVGTAAQDELSAALERYGFPDQVKAAKELQAQGQQLFKDWRLLTEGAMIPADEAIQAMGPDLADFVQKSTAAGQAIPLAMKPMVDQLIQSGQLLDENGNAFESAEAAGITFSETLDEQFAKLIDRIDQFIRALTGVNPDPITIPVNYAVEGMPQGVPGKASDYTPEPFADGGIARLPMIGLIGERGPEAVIPLDRLDAIIEKASGDGSQTTLNLDVALNPLQTHETVEQTVAYLVDRVRQVLGADLAQLIATGNA